MRFRATFELRSQKGLCFSSTKRNQRSTSHALSRLVMALPGRRFPRPVEGGSGRRIEPRGLADPAQGGNRDYAVGRVNGYPGPRHRLGGYTPGQVEGLKPVVPIWKRSG
jgi:hypothetical protein